MSAVPHPPSSARVGRRAALGAATVAIALLAAACASPKNPPANQATGSQGSAQGPLAAAMLRPTQFSKAWRSTTDRALHARTLTLSVARCEGTTATGIGASAQTSTSAVYVSKRGQMAQESVVRTASTSASLSDLTLYTSPKAPTCVATALQQALIAVGRTGITAGSATGTLVQQPSTVARSFTITLPVHPKATGKATHAGATATYTLTAERKGPHLAVFVFGSHSTAFPSVLAETLVSQSVQRLPATSGSGTSSGH